MSARNGVGPLPRRARKGRPLTRLIVSRPQMATHNARKLRDTPYDGALLLLVDGARPDVLTRLAAAGEMPVFKQHFVDRGGFREATSVFPTVSGPAHLPALTGLHPGTANIPGIRWAERPGKLGFLGHTRSYMSLFRQWKLSRDLGPKVSTLFQHLPNVADINTWFVRGCSFRGRRTRFSKALSFTKSLATKDWYSGDLQAEAALCGALKAGFRSAFVVFPSIDELGHRFGPLTDESVESYRRFDKTLGRLIDVLTKLGTYDRTLLVLTSDHGQSTTHTHFELSAFAQERMPRTLAYPKFWKHSQNADCVVMVSGNSMANIYLRGSNGWRSDVDVENHSSAQTLMQDLLSQESIEHVIYRRDPQTIVVATQQGRAVSTLLSPQTEAGPPRLSYSVEGADPLGYGSVQATGTPDEYLAATQASQFPDAPWQLIQFFRSARAGDLVVCAKDGFDLRDRYEYQPHCGSHGGLDRQHMMVPAAINARWHSDLIRSVDLFPTMLSALGYAVPAGIDGVERQLAPV